MFPNLAKKREKKGLERNEKVPCVPQEGCQREKDSEKCGGTWWVTSSISYDDLIQTQKSLFIQIAIVGAVALAGVAALLFLVVRRTLDPIKVVVDASEKISAGAMEEIIRTAANR